MSPKPNLSRNGEIKLYRMMESLNEFFDDCEKEYSQQVMIPESDIIQEPCIKKRRYSLDTEKLKENSKRNAERARERFSRYFPP